jgi:hypothetical protein
MPHQNTQSPKGTAQNAVEPSREPGDQPQGELDLRPEARSYTAASYTDASLAAPAAGEVADYMDEGDALGDDGVQQGSTHNNRPVRTEGARGQGAKTRDANRKLAGSGSPDQGTH